MSAVLQAQDDFQSVTRCQRTLLTRRVRNGEFPEEILEKAINSSIEKPVRESGRALIKRLFMQLGAELYRDRKAATEELAQRYYAPRYVKSLLDETDDPEVLVRAKEILKHWQDHPPEEMQQKTQAEKKLKMWYNLPTCLAKLRTYPHIYDQVSKYKFDHQRLHDVAKGLRIRDFPIEQRAKVIPTCLRLPEHSEEIPMHHFLQELSPGEWNNREMLNMIRDKLGDEKTYFDSVFFEKILQYLPSDLDLKDWHQILGAADERKGAIAALMVKTGDRKALPDFIASLNREWKNVRMEDGRIGGGGHSLFCPPFYQFKLLEIPAYREFAPEIIKGIEEKFADDRVAVHWAYLNAVRYFADTRAGLNLLSRLSAHECPQTAISACIILFKQGKVDTLKTLSDALKNASASDVGNNWHGILDVLRAARGRMLMQPEDAKQHRQFIEEAMKSITKHIHEEKFKSWRQGVTYFMYEELLPFGISGMTRKALIGMLSGYEDFSYWTHPHSAVKLLVVDAEQRGDLDQLLGDLELSAAAPDSTPGEQVLFVTCAMSVGAVDRMSASMREKLWKQLADEECPQEIVKAAWMLSPETVLDRAHPKAFEYLTSRHLLNPKLVDLTKVAEKFEAGDNPWKGKLLRLSYNLGGADLSGLDITWGDYNSVARNLCQMAWVKKPSAAESTRKLAEICEVLSSNPKNRSKAEAFVEDAPELLDRLGIKFDERKMNDWVATRVMAEIAYRKGDRVAYRRLADKVRNMSSDGLSYHIQNGLEKKMMILDLARGDIDSITPRTFHRDGYSAAYRLTGLLYEKGFAKEARAFRRLADEPGRYDKWDLSVCCLVWAWNEAMAGNLKEAVRLTEKSVVEARSKELADYALMLRRLLKQNSREFRRFVKTLRMRKSFNRRARCAVALRKLAVSTNDPDLKALAAFLAARMMHATGGTEDQIKRLWRMGAEANGIHSRYCKDALDAVPKEKEEFIVSSSWYNRVPMGPTFTPFTPKFGVCFKARIPSLLVSRLEWLDPYGIPVNVNTRQYFYNGSGWWLYIRDQAKSWVPGEWTITIRHKNGIEFHQRTLLPF